MINKRNIWFFTLFSLIIVLSVYYITMPNELNLETNTSKEIERVSEEVNDSTVLVALRVEKEEEYITEVESLRTILTSGSSTIEEKNNALKNCHATFSNSLISQNNLINDSGITR